MNTIGFPDDVLVQGLSDGFLGLVANQLLNHLASLEDQQGRDAGDPVAHWGGAVRVDVHLANLDFALIVLRQFLDDGSDGAAVATPGRPKVYEYGLLRFQNILVEGCIGYFDDSIAYHVLSPCCEASGCRLELADRR